MLCINITPATIFFSRCHVFSASMNADGNHSNNNNNKIMNSARYFFIGLINFSSIR